VRRDDPRRGGEQAKHLDGDEHIKLIVDGGRVVSLTGLLLGLSTGVRAFDRDEITVNAAEADRIRLLPIDYGCVVVGKYTIRRVA
jgi:hypothetical protein